MIGRIDKMKRVATSDGSGVGRISPAADFTEVESDDAAKIITLPPPRIGRIVAIRNGATGYELRSNDPEDVSINGGSGADAESAIPANTLTICLCDTETSYLCTNTATDGSVTTTDPAA